MLAERLYAEMVAIYHDDVNCYVSEMIGCLCGLDSTRFSLGDALPDPIVPYERLDAPDRERLYAACHWAAAWVETRGERVECSEPAKLPRLLALASALRRVLAATPDPRQQTAGAPAR